MITGAKEASDLIVGHRSYCECDLTATETLLTTCVFFTCSNHNDKYTLEENSWLKS